MKVKDIMNRLFSWTPSDRECAGDALVYGNDNKDVKKVAVCCIATCDVIKSAKEWGAEAIITHEPTLYSHFKESENDAVHLKKEA